MFVEFETEAEALSCFANLKNELLRREGAPKFGTENSERDLPAAAKKIDQLLRSKSLKKFYWENDARLLSLDLTQEGEKWEVSETSMASVPKK